MEYKIQVGFHFLLEHPQHLNAILLIIGVDLGQEVKRRVPLSVLGHWACDLQDFSERLSPFAFMKDLRMLEVLLVGITLYVSNIVGQGTALAAARPFLVEMLHQDLHAGDVTATLGVDA